MTTTPQELTLFEVTGNWLSVSAPALSGTTSDPKIEQVSGLVTITPRLPKGQTFLVSDYLVTPAYNTLQQVWLISSPISGTWFLSLDGFRTVNLSYSANAAAVEAAVAALPNVGTGNVDVTVGSAAKSFNIEFTGDLAEANVSPLASYSSLYNALDQNCPIEVTVVNQGTPQIVAETAVSLPTILARIWNGRLSAISTTDSPGVKLAANSAILNNKEPLIYDVSFSKVSFNNEDQVLAPFAFVAPEDNASVCLTDPRLQKLPFSSPINTLWSPATSAASTNNWRLRAV